MGSPRVVTPVHLFSIRSTVGTVGDSSTHVAAARQVVLGERTLLVGDQQRPAVDRAVSRPSVTASSADRASPWRGPRDDRLELGEAVEPDVAGRELAPGDSLDDPFDVIRVDMGHDDGVDQAWLPGAIDQQDCKPCSYVEPSPPSISRT